MGNAFPVTSLLGVSLHAITESECVATIMTRLRGGRGGWLVTPNLDFLRRSVCDPEFRDLIAQADLVVADGMPLVWASRLRGQPLPERVAGSSLISTLSAAAAREGRSVFLLGGAPGTAKGAAEILRRRSPRVRLAGVCCPPMGFDPCSSKDQFFVERVRTRLRESKPDIVFVGLGSPKQELLIERLRCTFPQTWWLGVGVSFSFLCGRVQRAPEWMQRSGLEWAHRLSQEPGRLARRYLVQGLPFAARLLTRSAWDRAAQSVRRA